MSDNILFLGLRRLSLLALDLVDTFVDLLDMLVDSNGVLGLANNLEQIFVRKEVESWEHTTLGGKKIIQLLLDDFEVGVELVEDVDKVTGVLDKTTVCVLSLVETMHLSAELSIDLLEDGVLLRKRLLDVNLSTEDAFKVRPSILDDHQEFKGVSDTGNVVLPHVDLVVELLVVS